MIQIPPIFTDLEALTSGTPIAISRTDLEFARRRTRTNIVLEGTWFRAEQPPRQYREIGNEDHRQREWNIGILVRSD